MMEISATDTSAIGIQRGFDRIESASATIASAEQQSGKDDRTVDALLELQQGKQQSQASTKALSAENDVIGALLSTKA